MRTLPRPQDKLIRFFETRLARWAADPAALGLDPARLATLAAATAEARDDLSAAIAARAASQAATTKLAASIEMLRRLGGPAISTIRAFAASSPDPDAVYSAAHIAPPAPPSPAPLPAPPTDVRFALRGDGSLELRWKARQPAPGAEIYTQIRRRLDRAGPFCIVGDTGAQRWIDTTIPAGAHQVEYLLTVKRADQESDPVIHTVLLGRPQPAAAEAASHSRISLAG